MELMGNDIFGTRMEFAFSSDHMEVLMSLYQPLLSKEALGLYYTLLATANQTQSFESHHTLCERMQLRIDEVEAGRIELEQFLLLRTMVVRKEKANIYYYVLQQPKSFGQFLKHDLFSRLLLLKVGSAYIRKLIEAQSYEDKWSEMEEITSHMSLDFSMWTYDKENQLSSLMNGYQDYEDIDPYSRYDIIGYLTEHDPTEFGFPRSLLTKEDIGYINYCGQMYEIAHDLMLRKLSKFFNRSEKILNREGLKSSCLYEVQLRGGTLPERNQEDTISGAIHGNRLLPSDETKYSLQPVQFVHVLSQNMKLSQSETESFVRLQAQYQFSNEVFNALLEYVWAKTSNFNTKYIDKICAVWSRGGVDTLAKARVQMEDSSANVRQMGTVPKLSKKTPRIVEKMPTYSESSNRNIEIDYDELNALLQSLEQKRQSS